ncbi:uncharacterized protein LAESUDRAFT_763606 [Laetiporus sulphureus 93-53]|uniref:Uncharacterized protein n=1 Tax=Laetiporus sulphureus 93-53 TaxID=1314785 RepID=A0A165BT58_9APHY|nr:uncharacterized protein LAESUDRAFT_763606 [Laetiporus sulphureus 93-53]KZT01603.1 hypothetical protein LAESUDRAFT_763606 [Laetiporus sulphureus 93-53]
MVPSWSLLTRRSNLARHLRHDRIQAGEPTVAGSDHRASLGINYLPSKLCFRGQTRRSNVRNPAAAEMSRRVASSFQSQAQAVSRAPQASGLKLKTRRPGHLLSFREKQQRRTLLSLLGYCKSQIDRARHYAVAVVANLFRLALALRSTLENSCLEI